MKVLIVDDSQAMRMLVMRTAKKAGLRKAAFIEAEDGVVALEKIKTEQPDLVLSDWNMPNMTGIELLEALNAAEIAVKFGFVTTEATAKMRSKARKAGAMFLLAKPFTAESFENAIWILTEG